MPKWCPRWYFKEMLFQLASLKFRKQQVRIIKLIFNENNYLDGSTYAFSVLNLEEKEIDELGDILNSYEHLRDLNLSKNKFETLD